MNNKPTFERFSTFEELKGIKKPNQALQYDSGKYYYIEDCPKKPDDYLDDNDKALYFKEIKDYQNQIKSTRIEVAPESAELIHKLLYRHNFGKKVTLPTDGIYPVQVKAEIKKTCKWDGDRNACGNEICWDLGNCQNSPPKQYAILSELGKDLSVSEGFEPKKDLPDAEEAYRKTERLLRAYDNGDCHGGNPMCHIEKYGKAIVDHYKTSLRKEIKNRMPKIKNGEFHEGMGHAFSLVLEMLDTITPQ